MINTLNELLERVLKNQSYYQENKQAICQGIVLPILDKIKWNRDDIREVSPQYPINSYRVDYALIIDNKPIIFLEVKKTEEELQKNMKKMLKHACLSKVSIAIFTNGFLWWFYSTTDEESFKQSCFLTLNIRQEPLDVVCSYFEDILSRDSIITGSAFTKAQDLLLKKEKERIVSHTIPKAWNDLLDEPDELLVELLAERTEDLCGHVPNSEQIHGFLLQINEYLKNLTSLKPVPDQPNTTKPIRSTGRKPIAYTFNGNRKEVQSWRDVIVGLCEDLNALKPNFFEEHFLSNSKNPKLSKQPSNLRSPREIDHSGFFIELNRSAKDINKGCENLIRRAGFSSQTFHVDLQD